MDLPIKYQICENTFIDIQPPVNQTKFNFHVDRYKGGGFEPKTVEGVAAMTYVTITNTLNRLIEVMDDIPNKWSKTNNLMIYPFAGKSLNASYNRKKISFFYDKDPRDGSWFFTSANPDIVAHELGHAILDSLRPDLWNAMSLEVWAFHEAFADIIAMLSLMQYDEVIEKIIKDTKGDLSINNIASDVAENFGRILAHDDPSKNPNYLRSAINNYTYTDPQFLPKKSSFEQLSKQPHSFSRVFFGAFYDMLKMIYEQRRLTNNDKQSLIDARNITARYIIEASRNAPASVRFFESIAKTILWVDYKNGSKWHDKISNIFSDRKIINYEFKTLSKPNFDGMIHDHGDGLITISHNKKEKIYYLNSDVEISIPRTEGYLQDKNGFVIDSHFTSENETNNAVAEMIDYIKLSNESSFNITNGELKRQFINCCGNKPLKNSQEYSKRFKPENNARYCGCSGNCSKPQTLVSKKQKKVKRSALVRKNNF